MSRDEALLTVRLVMRGVHERAGEDFALTALAAGEPGREQPTEEGWIFAYRDVAYGLIRKHGEGGEFVWESRAAGGARSSRLFDRAGQLLQGETVNRWIGAPASLRRALFGRRVDGDPRLN